MNARILAALLVGVLLGTVFHAFWGQPELQAQQRVGAPRLEYKTVARPDDPKEFEDILNKFGLEFWDYCGVQELVQKPAGAPAVGVKTVVFKRATRR